MNFNVDYCGISGCPISVDVATYSNGMEAPFRGLLAHTLALDCPAQRRDPLGDDIDCGVRLPAISVVVLDHVLLLIMHTSIVSNTLMTPGCRSVLNFRTAFLAKGIADRFEAISKENMLHGEPSSYRFRRVSKSVAHP